MVLVLVNENNPALKSTGHQRWTTFHNPIKSQWMQSRAALHLAFLKILFHSHYRSKMGFKEPKRHLLFSLCRNVRICHSDNGLDSPVPSLWASSASPRWWSCAPKASSRSPPWFQTEDLVWRYTPSAACGNNTWRYSLKTPESSQNVNEQLSPGVTWEDWGKSDSSSLTAGGAAAPSLKS